MPPLFLLVSLIVRLHYPLGSFLLVPAVKRGHAEVDHYHETYAPEYNYYTKEEYHPSYTQEYKPEYTQKYGYDYQYHEKPKYEYDYKPKYEYKYEKPEYFLCQLPPKEVPWYNDYYKWACKYY